MGVSENTSGTGDSNNWVNWVTAVIRLKLMVRRPQFKCEHPATAGGGAINAIYTIIKPYNFQQIVNDIIYEQVPLLSILNKFKNSWFFLPIGWGKLRWLVTVGRMEKSWQSSLRKARFKWDTKHIYFFIIFFGKPIVI